MVLLDLVEYVSFISEIINIEKARDVYWREGAFRLSSPPLKLDTEAILHPFCMYPSIPGFSRRNFVPR
jgi:hypothetical protein